MKLRHFAAALLAFASCQMTPPVDMTGVPAYMIVESHGYPETVTPNARGGDTYTYRDTISYWQPGGHYYSGSVGYITTTRRYYFDASGVCYKNTRTR